MIGRARLESFEKDIAAYIRFSIEDTGIRLTRSDRRILIPLSKGAPRLSQKVWRHRVGTNDFQSFVVHS